ncbi:hypothetical protein [Occultella kanbiaonis]|uniref:hypothetical protein n=1 Tax=Occultella kanbiaonis TaxID=2675754 RepID=UPI0013D02E87|nr:hypothetical protein [Occultella kanbiaonis]
MSYQGSGTPDGHGGHGASSGGYDPYSGGTSNPPGAYGSSSGGYDPYAAGNPSAPGGYGVPQNPSPYGAPGGYGAPEAPSPYGAPAAGGYGVPAGGYAAAGAYGAPGVYGGYLPPKKSNTGLIVGLVAGGVVLLIVIVAVLANVLGSRGSYGSDPELDRLYDQCAAGDNQACDDLYNEAPADSEYEEFGDTCGGRTVGGTWCVTEDF